MIIDGNDTTVDDEEIDELINNDGGMPNLELTDVMSMTDEEEILKYAEKNKESENKKAKQIASRVNKEGIVKTSSKDNLNKDDNSLAYYIKKIMELENLVRTFSAKLNIFVDKDRKRQREWQKMKEVSFDTQKLVKNIEESLGLDNDISDRDINEIANRVKSRVLKELKKSPTDKKIINTNAKNPNSKTILFLTSVVMLNTLLIVYLFMNLNSNTVKNSKKIDGVRLTKTVKHNAKVLCTSDNKKWIPFVVGLPLKNINGLLSENDNKFYFKYKNMICKTSKKNLR